MAVGRAEAAMAVVVVATDLRNAMPLFSTPRFRFTSLFLFVLVASPVSLSSRCIHVFTFFFKKFVVF